MEKNLFAVLISTLGRFDRANKKQICNIHFNVTEITARFIFPKRHLTLFPNTFVFQNTAKFSYMYISNCTNYFLQFFASRGNILV